MTSTVLTKTIEKLKLTECDIEDDPKDIALRIQNEEAPEDSEMIDYLTIMCAKCYSIDDILGNEAMESMAIWVSRYNVFLVDLCWHFDDLMILISKLTKINLHYCVFTDIEWIKLLQACVNANEISFHSNKIPKDHFLLLSKFPKLNCLKITSCDLDHMFFEKLYEFDNLKIFDISHLCGFNGPIHLPKSLEIFKMMILNKPFNNIIDFSQAFNLEEFSINNKSWSQPLIFDSYPNLRKILVQCRNFNDIISLKNCTFIEEIHLIGCTEWKSELILPQHPEKLKSINLEDCRQFQPQFAWDFSKNKSLEKINLTNCRKFNVPIIFELNKNLTSLKLTNCFEFNQFVKWQSIPNAKILFSNCHDMKDTPIDLRNWQRRFERVILEKKFQPKKRNIV